MGAPPSVAVGLASSARAIVGRRAQCETAEIDAGRVVDQNARMARGWESKSVESQQSEPEPAQRKRQLTAEEQERATRREGLEMSLGRIMLELETARSGVHRTALQNALKFLDEELAK